MSQDARHRLVTRLLDTDNWVSGPELARTVGVSARTIRNYAHSIPGINSSRQGYRAGPEARVWLESQRDSGPETPLERLYFIVKALLSSDGVVNLFSLCDQLFVAPPTLEADIGRARGLLQNHGLRIRRRGDELQIEGSEDAQRVLLRDLLIDSVATGPTITLDDLQHAFPDYDVSTLKKIVRSNLDAYELRINPIVESGVMLHILIMITRVHVGRPLPNTSDSSAVASGIADEFEEYLGFPIPDSERAYLSTLLDQRTGGLEPEDHATELVATALHQLSDEFQITFDDPALRRSLSLHVRSLLVRSARGTAIPNPFTNQIKQSHPLVYELAVAFAQHLGTAAGIVVDDDEKAFIAMHLGSYFGRVSPHANRLNVLVLMHGYEHLSQNTIETLRESLPQNVDLSAIASVDEVDSQTDLLITNVPVNNSPRPVIQVSPLLNQSDLERIRSRISDLLREQRVELFSSQLIRLVDTELFYVDPPARTPEQLIRFVSQDLISIGIGDHRFTESILERERLSPTGFPSGVAVPHPLKMGAKRSGLAVVSFQDPIKWNDYDVSLVVFIAFSQKERPLFNAMFDQLIELLSDPQSVKTLAERAKDFESFKQTAIALASAL
ncbi:BglG family transcription antiterminator [Actinomycetaceae bacterium MB13-C1-2]|nr:BglG family transcription antiterminator [Actinomycetaceae bacterium MB13-C1-2]